MNTTTGGKGSVTYRDVNRTGDFSFDANAEVAEYFDEDGNLVDSVPIDELMQTWLDAQPQKART